VTLPGAVIEVGQLSGLAAFGQTGQVFGRHRHRCRQQRDGRRPERLHPPPQPGRQQAVYAGQRRQGGALYPGQRHPGGSAQQHGDCHCLLLIQQERWHVGPNAQLVAPRRTRCAGHLVAEVPYPLDVPTDRASIDAELLGQLGAGPGRSPLQQGEEFEEPSCTVCHDHIFFLLADRSRPSRRGLYAYDIASHGPSPCPSSPRGSPAGSGRAAPPGAALAGSGATVARAPPRSSATVASAAVASAAVALATVALPATSFSFGWSPRITAAPCPRSRRPPLAVT
jgi:hypothetical protein